MPNIASNLTVTFVPDLENPVKIILKHIYFFELVPKAVQIQTFHLSENGNTYTVITGKH